ncbi:MAG: hypothetical protein IKI11_07170 [Neisseriaceae bacterium]|nr:hypothetical protein [Neisseriaceae bacterium]
MVFPYFRLPENSEQLVVSSEQLLCQALRLDGYCLDNTSIILSGCLKDLNFYYF